MTAKKNTGKMSDLNKMGCNSIMDMEEMECPNHPDLILLRDAAADEREAIADYFHAAQHTCMSELFLDIIEDEMQHYVMIMRHISMLDPVQAEMLREEGLTELTMSGMMKKMRAKWMEKTIMCEPEDAQVSPLDADELEAVCYLTNALVGEFKAINKYQCYMKKAEIDHNKHLFCYLMNDEKEHVAELTKAIFAITQEPLPPEID